MFLNVWGLPERYGSKLKEERIDAIAREVSRGSFDVYLLQELWMEQDHDKIAASLKKGFYMTGFRNSLQSQEGSWIVVMEYSALWNAVD